MRHQAENVEPAVEDPCDVVFGAVGVRCSVDLAVGVAITERRLSIAFDRLERFVVSFKIPLAMGDGEPDDLPGGIASSELCAHVLDPQVLKLADEPSIG